MSTNTVYGISTNNNLEKVNNNQWTIIGVIIVLAIVAAIIGFGIKYLTTEHFGSLPDNETRRKDLQYIMNQSNPTATEEIAVRDYYMDAKDPNFNTLNDLPFLIDPVNPTQGYYYNRVKMEMNPDSELMRKEKMNLAKVNKLVNDHVDTVKPPNDIGFKGYNNYVDLREDSYAPVYSIGKSLLVPYTDFPVPS